jgi:hypothetical protein
MEVEAILVLPYIFHTAFFRFFRFSRITSEQQRQLTFPLE